MMKIGLFILAIVGIGLIKSGFCHKPGRPAWEEALMAVTGFVLLFISIMKLMVG